MKITVRERKNNSYYSLGTNEIIWVTELPKQKKSKQKKKEK